jgi:hydrophobic/amphiphilic exporter-1 (mainly G- bacteria), HAE1 family
VGQGGAPYTHLPLGQVARIKRASGPAVINHLDRDNVVNVQANVAGRSLGEVHDVRRRRSIGSRCRSASRIQLGGEVEQQHEVFGQHLPRAGSGASC